MKHWKRSLTGFVFVSWGLALVLPHWDEIFCLLSASWFSLSFWGYALILVASLFLFAQWIWKRFHESYVVTWFRPETWRWDTELNWADVEKILEGDPLDNFSRFRGTHLGRMIYDLLKGLGGVLGITMFGYWTPTYLVEGGSKLPSWSLPDGSGTFLIGAVTVAVTFIVALQQHHAKVKSENRQTWINDVRKTLADVISEIPPYTYEHPEQRPNTGQDDIKKESTKEVQASRIKLELLMNPSEKDHRTLGWLLRRAYGIPQVKPDEKIPPDDGVFAQINALDRNERGQRNKLISYIVRLSNAILKREWERVKRGK